MTDRQKALEAVTQVLGDHELLSCTRVWEAWRYGTMREDDFVHAEDDTDIAESILGDLEGLGFVFVGPQVLRGTETQYGVEYSDPVDGRQVGVTLGELSAKNMARQLAPSRGAVVERTIITGPWRPTEGEQ
ncbi:hypothetical protein E3_0400 [Rhodococcus phage E3]|uniref:hypothetical protein n=1 Tax=Rhodococcus phage E3 TaxID=1007869 RepID=UPI0002C69909|nr:hypothetical protein M176_gp043 [Rhodococcus phage E3]AEQ20953.1 hypothetical protein E3_0400 [Rhodococcus phage E3]